MEREERYLLLKLSDCKSHLTGEQWDALQKVRHAVKMGRFKEGKKELIAAVVESDWPEYEPVWKAIEQRVDGPRPLPQMNKDVLSLVDNISKAVLTDEIAEGCDISAGMFGPAFSQLVHKLAVAQQKAELFDQLRSLMGYVQNGTDSIITLFQDDVTNTYTIKNHALGRKHDDWMESATSLESAIQKAFKEHGSE